MEKFYFTFGFNQKYENCFTVIEAENRGDARKEMFDKFGREWAFQYTEEEWIDEDGETQQDKYSLREIK